MIEKADAEFSRYVRRSRSKPNGWVACFTCGKEYEWKKIHCGHFMSRRHMNTRWDELNVAPQCSGCNTYRAGEQFIFSQNIDRIHGPGTSEELLILSRQTTKLTELDIEDIYNKYKNLNKELDKNEKYDFTGNTKQDVSPGNPGEAEH